MEYNNLRNKIGKFYNGGKIPKYENGNKFASMSTTQQATLMEWANKLGINTGGNPLTDEQISSVTNNARFQAFNPNFNSTSTDITSIKPATMPSDAEIDEMEAESPEELLALTQQSQLNLSNIMQQEGITQELLNLKKQELKDRGVIKDITPENNTPLDNTPKDKPGLSSIASAGMGIAAKAGTAAFNAIDQATMGDKNFGAQSQAIDSAVHGVSGALMSSGNPYAMLAGAALEGVNFLTKAGGQTVQGYDVNIENSGYGTLGHQESSSSRSFLFGLGDITGKKMQAKLARRNEQARMALQAAEISEDVKFEQEARMNSVDNVLRNNLIALAGGIDTSLLGN